jgi:hypothetical protein
VTTIWRIGRRSIAAARDLLHVAPVLGWFFLLNFWHDALHFAMSPSRRINAALP